MLKKTAFYAGSAALALILSACASQQPAPVVVGNSGSNSGSANTASNNPYGAAPYETNAANNDAPYTPPLLKKLFIHLLKFNYKTSFIKIFY